MVDCGCTVDTWWWFSVIVMRLWLLAVYCRDEADKSRRVAAKQRRKKSSEKLPKLKILSIENDGDVVECLLESGKHSTVVFKFSPDIDKTDDIADSLVYICMSE